MEITGKLKVKGTVQQVSEKFKKRDFVITDNSSQYPQYIQFELTQDKCPLLDNFNEGDEVKVLFNLRGREWTNKEGQVKYFNSLQAWKMEKTGSANFNQNTSGNESFAEVPPPAFTSTSNEPDDLPF